ncbi:MAG: hypothetical protein KKC72_10775, partial [Alphaproteobacteria bacterium]|nr:hypothetical protein [Alphaproteobacteria bacterium]
MDTLFRRNREWRQFSCVHLALAQISEVDDEALMKTSTSYHWDNERIAEIKSLQILSAFSGLARELLEKRQKRLEVPTLRSLAMIYTNRAFSPSGIAYMLYPPRPREFVVGAGALLTTTVLGLAAFISWW